MLLIIFICYYSDGLSCVDWSVVTCADTYICSCWLLQTSLYGKCFATFKLEHNWRARKQWVCKHNTSMFLFYKFSYNGMHARNLSAIWMKTIWHFDSYTFCVATTVPKSSTSKAIFATLAISLLHFLYFFDIKFNQCKKFWDCNATCFADTTFKSTFLSCILFIVA